MNLNRFKDDQGLDLNDIFGYLTDPRIDLIKILERPYVENLFFLEAKNSSNFNGIGDPWSSEMKSVL